MVTHSQTIRRQQPTNSFSVSDHFVGLALKGLRFWIEIYWICCIFRIKKNVGVLFRRWSNCKITLKTKCFITHDHNDSNKRGFRCHNDSSDRGFRCRKVTNSGLNVWKHCYRSYFEQIRPLVFRENLKFWGLGSISFYVHAYLGKFSCILPLCCTCNTIFQLLKNSNVKVI